jgi:outer membrane protein OmpA-like peptidoglycan-associated protein
MKGSGLSIKLTLTLMLGVLLNSCTKPPYYEFESDGRTIRSAAMGTVAGGTVGLVAGNTLAGAAIGGVTGALYAGYQNTASQLIKSLQRHDIEVYHYGDTTTIIVPTDKYFVFDSARLNQICYPGLNILATYVKSQAVGPIYIASFTDNVGSKLHKSRLSQAQAETMLTFLWAHEIPVTSLHAEGYADKHGIANDKTIRGSALNRRLEIQWHNPSVKRYAFLRKKKMK